jgi:hypothetical protein
MKAAKVDDIHKCDEKTECSHARPSILLSRPFHLAVTLSLPSVDARCVPIRF